MKIEIKNTRFRKILIHFFQIDAVTVEAQKKANETSTKVDELFDNLSQLQKNVVQNEIDAKEIKTQSEIVRNEANKAHEGAVKVQIFNMNDLSFQY